ncbi:uncharacterized protein LOC143899363 [Temnothorax americanus]|uniref:uncharacterized protein n=1 Tax=Temnothorax longispinosus TaxID=300112 RepID=UPI003A9A60F3
METTGNAYIKRDAAENILVDGNGNVTCESKDGVIFYLKYKDIDFTCDTLQCYVDDKLMSITLRQNVEQNEQTNDINSYDGNCSQENNGNDENNANYENNANRINQDRRETFFWDDATTKLFLELYEKNSDLLVNRKIKTKKILWQKITESMQKHGYNVTLVQVENKYKSLERSFKNMILNNNKTGRARMSCPYEQQLTKLLGHKHNIRPLAISGKQGLLLRDDVQISTALQVPNLEVQTDKANTCDMNNQNGVNLNTDVNVESTSNSRNTTSEINASHTENDCSNQTLSHSTHRKQTVRTTRVTEIFHKTIEKLLSDIQHEKEIKNEIQTQLVTEYKAMRNTYEQSVKNIEEQLIKANQLREERNELLREIYLKTNININKH